MTLSTRVLRLMLILLIFNGCVLEAAEKEGNSEAKLKSGDNGENDNSEVRSVHGISKTDGNRQVRQDEGAKPGDKDKTDDKGGGKRRFMADLRNEANPDDEFEVMTYVNDVIYTPTQAQEIYMEPQEKIIIWRTLAVIEKETCIRFISKRELDNDYVNLTKHHWDPIQSNLGTIGGVQNVNLHSAHDLDKYAILHLFLHTLGFPHQHVVPNRDEHVKILWENVSQQFKSDFIKLTQMDYAEIFKDYDPKSIMHYDSYAATRNGKPTILKKDGGQIRPSATLSKKDFDKLNQFYAC